MISERYIAVVYSLKYVYFMTSTKTVAIIATSWGIPTILFLATWAYETHFTEISSRADHIIVIVYTLLFEIASTIILVVATLHIMVIARKISIQMSSLLTQVRYNRAANSAITVNAPLKSAGKHLLWEWWLQLWPCLWHVTALKFTCHSVRPHLIYVRSLPTQELLFRCFSGWWWILCWTLLYTRSLNGISREKPEHCFVIGKVTL